MLPCGHRVVRVRDVQTIASAPLDRMCSRFVCVCVSTVKMYDSQPSAWRPGARVTQVHLGQTSPRSQRRATNLNDAPTDAAQKQYEVTQLKQEEELETERTETTLHHLEPIFRASLSRMFVSRFDNIGLRRGTLR